MDEIHGSACDEPRVAKEDARPEQAPQGERDPRRVAMTVSLLVSFLMLAGKLVAYFITGSAAIFSDAAESVIHLLATAFVGFSLWYAFQPADSGHPYGHGKIAYIATGFEGSMILVAAVAIIYTAVTDLIRGPELRQLGVGLWMIGSLGLVNLLLGLYLVRTGRRHNNLVLVSNGQHVLTDMWTSLGVVAGVALVWLTGIVWLDPIVAIIMALNILATAFSLMRRAYEGLMEKADEHITQSILNELAHARAVGLICSFHQVRYRRVHDQVWVEYHLLFPNHLTITEAHRRSHEVEDAVARLFPDDEVTVTAHLEPEHHAAFHPAGHQEPADPLADGG